MQIVSRNKRISFDYEITDTREVGIILQWHEVKSIRTWKINITDAAALIHDQELWLHNLDIPLYAKANPNTITWYEAKWKRKLLVKKIELSRMSSKMDKTGARLVVMEVYFTESQRIKVKLWLWKRKKKVEKRSSIKDRESKRQIDKAMKNY